MTSLSIRGLTVSLGDNEVLSDVSLRVDSGSSLAVLGASGVGKTTLLRAVAGLAPVNNGQIMLGWDDVTNTPTHERGLAFVTQQPTLEPNSTLASNVERPLRYRGDELPERRHRALRELFRFGVGSRANARANETSLGEQQSAATARGTVRDPKLLLLDEPVIALDPDARRQMIRQLRLRQQTDRTTMLIATNDWEVAAGLADRIAVLTKSGFAQVGDAAALYDEPATTAVAELTGRWRLNRLSGMVRRLPGAQPEIVTAAGPIRTWREISRGQVLVGIRPSDLTVDDIGALQGTVTSQVVLGRRSLVEVDSDGLLIQALGPVPPPETGAEVRLSWRRAHIFSLEGQALWHLEPM